MAHTSIGNVTQTTLSWYIGSLGNHFNTIYYIRAGIANNPVVDENTAPAGIIDYDAAPSSSTNTFTLGTNVSHGKSPGTYTAYGWAQAANGRYYSAGSDSYTVPSPPLPTLPAPSVANYSASKFAIGLTLTAVTGADTYYARLSGAPWHSSSGVGFTLAGLSPNTTYTVEYKCSGTGYNDSAIGSIQITTASDTRPNNWSWSSSNGTATAGQTQDAYKAVTKVSGYFFSDFHHSVWNDLVDKVDEFAIYKYVSKCATGTKTTAGDKELTALRFNKLLSVVNSMASTGITARAQDQEILGSYFTTITAALNSIV